MFAIRAGFAFDGDRPLQSGALVVCDGERIIGVEPGAAPFPDGCEVVDAPTGTLLPGLVDAHVHLCGDGTDGTLERLGEIAAESLPSVIEDGLRRQLVAGVTTVRDLGDRQYAVVDFNVGRRRGDGLPTVVASGPPITRLGGHCANMGGEASGVTQMREAVRARAERGVHVVKVMGSGGFQTTGTDVMQCQFTLEELRAAVDEAHRIGLPATVHAHPRVAVLQAMDAGANGIEHCSFVSERGFAGTAQDLRRLASVPIVVCPTVGTVGVPLPLTPNGRALFEKSGMSAERIVQMIKMLPARLHEAGVRLVAGADSGISSSKPHGMLPVTLAWYVEGGVPINDTLAVATSKAAEVCGLGQRKGRLRAGYDADLLLVEGDATTDVDALGRPLSVWLAGTRAQTGPQTVAGRASQTR